MVDISKLSDLRVLVVEDEGLVMMLIQDYLEELGCHVVATAMRINDALIQARSASINMALLDVNLAGTLSYPVATILAERSIPFIFATGYGSLAVPDAMQSVPVLPKPFLMEQLAKVLEQARST